MINPSLSTLVSSFPSFLLSSFESFVVKILKLLKFEKNNKTKLDMILQKLMEKMKAFIVGVVSIGTFFLNFSIRT